MLNKLILPIAAMIALSCNRGNETIVSSTYIDSLLSHYTPSAAMKANEMDIAFWEKRMDSMPDNYVNGLKYASALAARFRLYGNIHDLKKADSLVKESNTANQEKEDGILFTLANFAMLQHQFKEAGEYATQALKASDNKYGGNMAVFDASFEIGRYDIASRIIKTTRPNNTYPYYFRRSRYEHLYGSLDTSIAYMMRAAGEAAGNKYLEQAAISNAADLNIHKGDLRNAYTLFKKSISIDASDFHSIIGIGWIALVHDKNDSLAEKIFSFAAKKLQSPDPLLKMIWLAEFRKDKALEEKYAKEFVKLTTNADYGAMYNKYLIEIYTSVLNEPGKAIELAKQETESRPTPQAYAWYAWALLKNNEAEKAYNLYRQYISGKPLEGLELYYMGKLMKSLNKGYNAKEFFKAAIKNQYDLSPAQSNDLEESL